MYKYFEIDSVFTQMRECPPLSYGTIISKACELEMHPPLMFFFLVQLPQAQEFKKGPASPAHRWGSSAFWGLGGAPISLPNRSGHLENIKKY